MTAFTRDPRRALLLLLACACVVSLPAVAGPRGSAPADVRVSSEPAATGPQAVVATGLEPVIERGEALSERCARCHGVAGAGLGDDTPKLAALDAIYLEKQLKALRSGERTPAAEARSVYQALTDQDIVDIAAFLAESARYKEPRGDVTLAAKGKKLYQEGRVADEVPPCVGCHGSRGDGYTGVLPGGIPAIGAQRAGYIGGELAAYRAGIRTTDPNGVMRFAAKNLDDADIRELSTYIQGMLPEGTVPAPNPGSP